MSELIVPHGGKLVDRIARDNEREILLEEVQEIKAISLSSREVSDLEMIGIGAMSPIEGFLSSEDYNGVVDNMRLTDGTVWTLPISLSVSEEEAKGLKEGENVALKDSSGTVLAVLHLEEKFPHDKEKEASEVYGTRDKCHPGVLKLYEKGNMLLGGKISLLKLPKHQYFSEYRLTPLETRRLFKERGWKRIVGFQTRNPIHRAHEYIQKCALETVDGLLVHPLMGATKADDISGDLRMKCYEVLLAKYYPTDRVALGIFPAAMRYAGPREAVFHALVRKNYGCSHFIVGRDHAGVGNYYGSFDAHYIFDKFDQQEIDIIPMFFDYTFYCKECGGMASYKTCPHSSKEHIALSGTMVRNMLRKGEIPPEEFTRPEIAKILIKGMKGSS
ncbi:MAG: sulfate adenylyltransferase [Thermodesulfobacteriota bacterium]